MKKATILGALGLLAVVTALFAGPALSSPRSQQVTIKSLARQVNSLGRQVAAAQSTAKSAQRTATRLAKCLQTVAPVTGQFGYVRTDAESGLFFTRYDPAVQGLVPAIPIDTNWSYSLTGAIVGAYPPETADSYLAIVEPSCVDGYIIR
jgi:hypothetical protein